jgi:hypothetical protein
MTLGARGRSVSDLLIESHTQLSYTPEADGSTAVLPTARLRIPVIFYADHRTNAVLSC